MIVIDANVFMYAAGRAHPHRAPSLALLKRVAERSVPGATDAEVLQEILHRYRASGEWKGGLEVYRTIRIAVERVLPITAGVVDRARDLLDEFPALSARDAVHAAVCLEARADAICSYDRDFDALKGILERVEP